MPMTASQAETFLQEVVELCYEFLSADFSNTVTNLDNAEEDYLGDRHEEFGRAYGAVRRNGRATFTSMRDMLLLALQEWGEASAINNPYQPGSREWWVRMRQYLDDVGPYVGGSVDKKVTALGWTRGGEPSLTGFKVKRLTVDEYGQAIETGFGQTVLLESITGPGRLIKAVRLAGADTAIDVFQEQASPLGIGARTLEIRSIDENNITGNVLANPTLASTVSDGSTISTLSGWTLSGTWKNETGSPLLRTQGNVIYSTTDGDYIEQSASIEMSPRIPYLPAVWVYPSGLDSGDGVVINWGGKSQAFTGLTNTTWQLLTPDRDLDLFPLQFDDASNGRRIRVTFDNDAATGTLYIGAVHWVPMIRYDGVWYAIFSDTSNPIAGSKATIADSISVAGKIQQVMRMMFYVLEGNEEAYLPTSGTNTLSDP